MDLRGSWLCVGGVGDVQGGSSLPLRSGSRMQVIPYTRIPGTRAYAG